MRLLDADAEDPADGFGAERRAVFLRVLAVRPERRQSLSRLTVREKDVRQFANRLHIQRAECAATTICDESRVRCDGADLAVPELPQLKQAPLVPGEIRPARRIARIVRARQYQSSGRLEVALAVLAVAHPRSRPPVAEDSVNGVPGRDLAVDLGHELEVVRTQRARHPELGRCPVPP